jgi:hypothetical protein
MCFSWVKDIFGDFDMDRGGIEKISMNRIEMIMGYLRCLGLQAD